MTLVTKAYLLIALSPLLHVAAAFLNRSAPRWQLSRNLSLAALAAALAGGGLLLASGGDTVFAAGPIAAPYSLLISVMIGLLGAVIVQFSRNYLAGEPGEHRYLQMLHTALAAILATVLTDHAGVLLFGWAFISFALHELLLFYSDRPAAVMAARKKFLMARAAEVSLAAAVLLLVAEHDTWSISAWMAHYPAELSGTETLAAVLVALAALIKCAQMPSHGWLIQVVEAPTPVSALLHAGIINLGGYLLILFGPLVTSALSAQALVLVIAGGTFLAASREMQRQPAIKAKMAWSTCAQMALMLIEAALGLYELALLHLYSHAFYKAYLFLRSGSAVEQFVIEQQAGPRSVSVPRRIGGMAAAIAMVTGFALATGSLDQFASWLLVAIFIGIALGEAPLRRWRSLLGFALVALAAYSVQKLALGLWLVPEVAATVDHQLTLFVGGLVSLTFLSLWAHWFQQSAVDARDPARLLTFARRLAAKADSGVTLAVRAIWREPRASLERGPLPYSEPAEAE